MTFGEEGKEGMPPLEYSLRRYGIHSDLPSIFSGARVHDLNEVKTILDIFQKHGHYEARILRLCAIRIESTVANCDHCTTHRLTRRLYSLHTRAASAQSSHLSDLRGAMIGASMTLMNAPDTRMNRSAVGVFISCRSTRILMTTNAFL